MSPLLSLVKNDDASVTQSNSSELKKSLAQCASELESLALSHSGDFKSFEVRLREMLWAMGRIAIVLFLARRHEQTPAVAVERDGRRFRPAPSQARNLNTLFGVVRYWRAYLREVAKKDRHGFYPLDDELGLTGDRVTFNLLVVGVRLALKLSFAEARSTLGLFVPCPPSTEVIEKTVLGLGRHTAAWFESAPAPEGDGEVLVAQIDSKGAPTATESELERRRGKRQNRPRRCRRHRGRNQRSRYGKKPRRKKGDKSKNAKLATMVVMYTLRRGKDDKLHGPLNVWRYASFAPKRHAFAVAAREAQKRGFGPDSGKRFQLLTDGDNDLAYYAQKLLPHALHTIDVMHVVERLWSAGECLYDEGTPACLTWVEERKDELYKGKAAQIVEQIQGRLNATPKTGPGNKGKRERLFEIIRYLEKRLDRLDYKTLIKEDLELGTGMVEGTIKNTLGKRCDHGGMRWIKERVEAVVQLRCIEANGDFDRFTEFVQQRLALESKQRATIASIQTNKPSALPTFGLAA